MKILAPSRVLRTVHGTVLRKVCGKSSVNTNTNTNTNTNINTNNNSNWRTYKYVLPLSLRSMCALWEGFFVFTDWYFICKNIAQKIDLVFDKSSPSPFSETFDTSIPLHNKTPLNWFLRLSRASVFENQYK